MLSGSRCQVRDPLGSSPVAKKTGVVMKKLYLFIVVTLIAAVTLPLWGSCDLNAKACSSWCEVRHYGSDLRIATCKAECTTDRLRCLTNQGSEEVGRFLGQMGK